MIDLFALPILWGLVVVLVLLRGEWRAEGQTVDLRSVRPAPFQCLHLLHSVTTYEADRRTQVYGKDCGLSSKLRPGDWVPTYPELAVKIIVDSRLDYSLDEQVKDVMETWRRQQVNPFIVPIDYADALKFNQAQRDYNAWMSTQCEALHKGDWMTREPKGPVCEHAIPLDACLKCMRSLKVHR